MLVGEGKKNSIRNIFQGESPKKRNKNPGVRALDHESRGI